MASFGFNPGKMLSKIWSGYRETKRLGKTPDTGEDALRALEEKYNEYYRTINQTGVMN